MKRHPFDITSFLFGLVLGAAAAGFLLAQGFSWDVDGRWVLPTALIILGVAGIAGAVSGLRPGGAQDADDDQASSGGPETSTEPEGATDDDSADAPTSTQPPTSR